MQQMMFEFKKKINRTEQNKTLNCREILRVQKQTKKENNWPTMQKEREKESLLTCVCII